jgi:ankyrin repeat protein
MSRLLSIAFKADLVKLKQEFARNPQSAQDADAFCQAIGWNKTEIVKEFLANGADPNCRDRNGNHPLFMVCLNYGGVQILDALLAAGSARNRVPELAFIAAQCSRVEVIQRLMEVGVDFSSKDEAGWTPLALAASNGREDIVDFLLERGATIAGLDTSKPIKPFKGCPATKEVMERIRAKIASPTEPGAAPNGGPTKPPGSSSANGGPPWVS